MTEWLVQAGIGERCAALIERDEIVEIAIERDEDAAPRAGAIMPARLARGADATGRGLAELPDGTLVHLSPVPAGLAEGARLAIEVVRERLPEAGAWKPPRARVALPGTPMHEGLDLVARLRAGGTPMRLLGRGETLDAFGWTEALEEAASGLVARADVLLRISPTPAMTLIDVDGASAPATLALAGGRAAGEAIRRFGIAGSIGIDLPTLERKSDRQAAAAGLDAALPPPFERTAVNGFGFLQVVRRRVRMSVIERLQADPVAAAVHALLHAAERAGGAGEVRLAAHPRVAERLASHPEWLEALRRRMGVGIALQADEALAISKWHVARAHP